MDDQFVTIMKLTEFLAVRFVKEKLEFEGIECFLTDEGFDHTSDEPAAGWNLKVKASEVEKTVQLLLKINKQYNLDDIQKSHVIPDLKRILVPIDLKSYSLTTCKLVLAIAEEIHAEIKFLYVLDDPNLTEHVQYRTSWETFTKIEREEAYANAQVLLQEFSDRLKSIRLEMPLLFAKYHFAIYAGNLENKIVNLSQLYSPDLVVLEQKKHDTKERIHLARVTHYIIDHSRFPVLTIPEDFTQKSLSPLKIMYATDLHDPDHSAMDRLLEILKPFHTKISCIHLEDEHNPITREQIDEINLYLKKLYPDSGIQAYMYESADMTLGIDEFIAKNQIDWISLPAHKRNFIYKIFHSDILDKMMLASNVPMLIFQAP